MVFSFQMLHTAPQWLALARGEATGLLACRVSGYLVWESSEVLAWVGMQPAQHFEDGRGHKCSVSHIEGVSSLEGDATGRITPRLSGYLVRESFKVLARA